MFFTGLAVSFLIGGYDGFYGPGTGTFLILVFTGLLKLGTRDAAGISKVVNLSADIGALGTFFVGGKVDYALGIERPFSAWQAATLERGSWSTTGRRS